jgi:hypothetical protein
MPEIADKRELIANQLLMRQQATMLELLTAAFGEWPPKGLEINPLLQHGQIVLLKEIHNSGKRAGGASDNALRQLALNKELCEKFAPLYQFLAHESIHVLQGDHSFRMKKDLLGRIAGFFGRKDEPVCESIMEKLTSREENPLSNQFNATAIPLRERMLYYMHHQALRRGSEVQARIHQIVIDGYPRWGAVPATTDEFYAAMKNAGFRLPDHIEKHLEELPGNSSARQFLNCESGACQGKVKEIELVVNSFAEGSQKDFWNKIVLDIYSDLIEMYGDVQGRARFGLGVNPKTQMPLKYFPGQTDVKKSTPALS